MNAQSWPASSSASQRWRVADCADAHVEIQVRSGLVVRMAVLYDLLVGGPVGVRALAAAEVA